MGKPDLPPIPETFLANMRAKLAQTAPRDRPALVSINIDAMERREREIEAWASRDDDRPHPYPGLNGFGIALILGELFAMHREALDAVA